MRVLDLGLAPYTEVQDLQNRLRQTVLQRRLDGVLLVLEHPPTITLGKHASVDDITDPIKASHLGVQVARSERGGQSTLHAPGQLVAYPIIAVPRRNLRAYVHSLEEVVLQLLHTYRLSGSRVSGRPGIYVNQGKIASVGLRCEHGVSSHGTALNVNLDLTLFGLITSCGDPSLRQTSIEVEMALPCDVGDTKIGYVETFARVFGLPLTKPEEVTCQNAEALLGLRAGTPE